MSNIEWDLDSKSLTITMLIKYMQECGKGKIDIKNIDYHSLQLILNALNHYYSVGNSINEINCKLDKIINSSEKT